MGVEFATRIVKCGTQGVVYRVPCDLLDWLSEVVIFVVTMGFKTFVLGDIWIVMDMYV